MPKRIRTNYPGVHYRTMRRIGGPGLEKVYYITFYRAGKLHEEKAGAQFRDGMTAAKAARVRGDRIEGKRLSRREIRERAKQSEKWTISRLWLEYRNRNPQLKGLSTDGYRFRLHLEPQFGAKEPKEIVPLDVDRLRLNMSKSRAPQTVQNTLELLRRLINFGVKKHLCPGLNFTIQMPKVDNEKTEDLTPEQLERLLQVLDETPNVQVANMMKIALFTGMRRGELFKLEWRDVDFDRGLIHIRDPKGGHDQTIPLNDPARELLEAHPRTENPYVFPDPKTGGQRSDVRKAVRNIKAKAGLPPDFRGLHGLRHVYASMLASSGKVDLYTLQRLLTHKDPKTTQRYAHLRDEALRKAANVVGEVIGRRRHVSDENVRPVLK